MRITVGNPALRPYLSDNFEISVERYVETVGLLSAGVFRKNISRYFRSFTDVVGSEGIDGSGLYAGYERTISRNIGSAKIQGFELNFQQQFRRLPGLLSGLGAFANFTYVKAEGDFGAQAVTSRIPNLSPRLANLGLSYVGHGWQVRPLLNWQDKTYRGTSGTMDYDSTARTRVDLKAQYSPGKRYSVELSVFNLTNEPDDELISSDGRLPFAQLKSGVAYSLGITGRF
jgi:TonB-dependent receptor